MHYLVKRVNELSSEERFQVMEQLIESTVDVPKTTVDQQAIRLLSDYTDAAIELNKHWGKMHGLSTGYKKLDALTKGLAPGEMTVLAGKTSYGKTTLGINIANQIALSGKSVLFITLEMTREEIASRFMHINGGETDEYNTVASLIAVQASNDLNWQSIDGLVGHAKKELDIGLVVVDHLHYFSRELEKLAEDLGRITKEFKKNAQDHKIPIILISHVRRTDTKRDADIDDLRGSSYIGQDADIVLMVGRDQENQHSLKVKIHKNRNRGYDYNHDVADMYIDGIKVYDEQPLPFM